MYQLRWPDRSGGANRLSLIEAQHRFIGLAGRGDVDGGRIRPDVTAFEREPSWRPVAADRDRFEPRGGPLAPWPDDRTVLYWWRRQPASTWWDAVEPVDLTLPDTDDPQVAEFRDAVCAVAEVAPPADPDNLSGMSVDFDHYLWRCPSIREVVVSSGPDPARQLTARCLAEPLASRRRVAAEIEAAWRDDLRYEHWEAHLLRVTPTSVELDVATQINADGYYITGLIVVTWAATTHSGEGDRGDDR